MPIGAEEVATRGGRRRRIALQVGIIGAFVGAAGTVVGALPGVSSPLVALIVTTGMVGFFGGLWQVSPPRLRRLTQICGGMVIANASLLFFLSLGVFPFGAFTVSEGMGAVIMALMFLLHVLQRTRLPALLVLLALLAGVLGSPGLAEVGKGGWLFALGIWLLDKLQQQTPILGTVEGERR